MKQVFLDHLPRYKEGNQKGKIDWVKCIGLKIDFIFTSNKTTIKRKIEGHIDIVDYNKEKQMLTVKYKDKQKNIRTSDIHSIKLSNLLKEEIYQYNIDKTKENWIDFSNVPLNGKGIDWNEIIKQNIGISFKYKEFEGEIYIIKYLKNKYLLVKYLDYEPYAIPQRNLFNCKLGCLLEVINYKYIYDVGNIIKGKYSDIEILELFRKEKGFGMNVKWYKYKCLSCNLKHEILETSLLNGTGCPVCAGKKVLVGINDIPTTAPWMVKYFQGGYDEAKLYTSGSGKTIKPICPDCGTIRNKPIPINILKRTKSIACKCNDGIPYPEKFMIVLLNQLNIKYEYNKVFDWSDRKEYDFYIPYLNCIIETHGDQHYKNSFYTIHKGRTLEKEQENDEYKENIALDNGISNYIIIDCRKSELEYIKKNILNSKLNKFFDLSNIDWNFCEEYALKNIVKEVCNIKKLNPNFTSGDIAKITNLCIQTIIKYLKLGNKYKWCIYDIKQERSKIGKRMSGNLHPNCKKVICLTTNELFDTATQAEIKYNICKVGECCNGNRKSAGKHPETREPLKWIWYNDFLENKEQISILHKNCIKIICTTTGEIFNSITDAQNKYNMKNISLCCNGKYKHVGKNLITGEKLKWMYYDDYLKENEVII